MEKPDLDKEIKKWIRSFRKFRSYNHGAVREMELHIRDHIDDLVGQGYTEEEAFHVARNEFGNLHEIAREEDWNIRKKRNINSIINNSMLNSYLKVALRHFRKHKFHSALNIIGLTTGLAIVIFIFLFVSDELRYDQHFPKKDVLYRVVENQYYSGQPVFPVAVTPTALAPALKDQFPEIVNATRVAYQSMNFQLEDRSITEEQGLMVDASFFDMFSTDILSGDAASFKSDIHALVLTKEMADKYFPDQDVIGQSLTLDNEEFIVRAVIADPAETTHLPFRYLVNFERYLSFDPERSQSWGSNWLYTYIEVDPGTDASALDPKLTNIIKENNEGSATEIYLQPVTDIYLGEVDFVVEAPNKGEMLYVNIFTLVAIFILIISCINFMNLATAKSENRAKEVGLRKTVGAARPQLIFQFLSESVLMSVLALVLALALVITFLPFFNELTEKSIALTEFRSLDKGLSLALVVLGAAVFAGIISGIYPALVLSSPMPALTLKNNGQPIKSGSAFRKVLVITQFTISIILILGTLVVSEQLHYIQDIDLGYDKHNLAYVRAHPEKAPQLAETLRNESDVLAVGLTNMHPGYVMSSTSGFEWQGKNPDENILLHTMGVDEYYLSAMEMEILEGRDFHQGDSTSIIINQRAAEIIGMENPIGAKMANFDTEFTIIGVVGDFNFKSVHTAIEPLVIYMADEPSRVFIRYRDGQEARIKEVANIAWNTVFPDEEFEISYLEDDWKEMYTAEERTSKLSTYFSAIAIIVSCLGLFGLVSYTAEQRTREIGIRKVLGASVSGLFIMLATDFTKLILASLIISVPLGIFLMNQWLDSYAYHIDISMMIILTTVLGVILITIATISYQSLKISLTNPVNVLKRE